jgi:prepilin signal peptidase PulO-like enzyme (type II secretory pathway)
MFDPITSSSLGRDLLAALIGLCVGSFLNVLALRSLKEQSLISPPSTCPHCNHRIKFYDLIPVLSYVLLGGKCRHCHKPIDWQYPFVEIFTACTFVALLHRYGPQSLDASLTWMNFSELIGMTIFCSTLIAICITDFKEKLIPHEITYPSMLLGIIYSGVVRNDLAGALIGIGVSYMLFDFMAFYGLKYYIWRFGDPDDPEVKRQKKILIDRDREGLIVAEENEEIDAHIDHVFDVVDVTEEEEEFMVMGGGDAVLSAVMSAWLGYQLLGIALMIGFLAGTVMGGGYLIYEMYKLKVLKNSIVPALIGMAILVAIGDGMLLCLKLLTGNMTTDMPYLQVGIAAAVCGALLGVLHSGQKYSKPFPFGPALAFGAVVAMLCKTMVFPGAQ